MTWFSDFPKERGERIEYCLLPWSLGKYMSITYPKPNPMNNPEQASTSFFNMGIVYTFLIIKNPIFSDENRVIDYCSCVAFILNNTGSIALSSECSTPEVS